MAISGPSPLTHARVKLLVVLLRLGGADVDETPFEVYCQLEPVEEADTPCARAKGTPTFGQRSNGLKLDAEVVLVIKLGRVVDELNVANVDLTR
jgi:hypothetical protein